MGRQAKIERKTKETDIHLLLDLDGKGFSKVNTSIPFMDHMLSLLAAHGFLDIELTAKGDTEIDYHHTVEDLGICLGMGIKEALGEKRGIRRYGETTVPMDEALVRVVIGFGRYRINVALHIFAHVFGELRLLNVSF